jgi:hypothetical protein
MDATVRAGNSARIALDQIQTACPNLLQGGVVAETGAM